MKRGFVQALAGAVCLRIFSCAASSAEYTWARSFGGAFSDPANWTPTGGPPGPDDTAAFNAFSPTPATITVASGTAINELRIANSHAPLNLSGGTMTLNSTSSFALFATASPGTDSQLTLSNGTFAIPNGGMLLSSNCSLQVNADASVSGLSLSAVGSGSRISVSGHVNTGELILDVGSRLGIGGVLSTILPLSGGGFSYGDVYAGYDSSSSFTIAGGTFASGGDFRFGFTRGSFASLDMMAGSLQVGTPTHPSNMFFGEAGGAFTFTAAFTVWGDLYVGHLPNSNADISNTACTVGGNVHIGADPAIPVSAGSSPAVGKIEMPYGRTLSAGGTIFVHPGGTLDTQVTSFSSPARGTVSAALLHNFGLLIGAGVFNTSIINDGQITPTNSNTAGLGHMEVHGTFTQSAAGVLNISYDAAKPLEIFTVFGDMDMGGTINFSPTDTAALRPGEMFLLARCTGTATGLPALVSSPGLSFSLLATPQSYFAVVAGTPEPSGLALFVVAGGLLVRRRHSGRHIEK